MKLDNIKNALSTLLFSLEKVEFGKMTTDKGIIGFEEAELTEGATVFLVGENDEKLPIEDGEYTADEVIVTVTDGKAVSIVKKEVEEEKPEQEERMEEEVENPTNEGEETDNEAIVKLREEVNELYKRVDELEEIIKKLDGKPADKPAEEQFEVIKKTNNIPLKGKERANALMRLAKK